MSTLQLVDVPQTLAREDLSNEFKAVLVAETYEQMGDLLALAEHYEGQLGRAVADANRGLSGMQKRSRDEAGAPAAQVSLVQLLGALGRLRDCVVQLGEISVDLERQALDLPIALVRP